QQLRYKGPCRRQYQRAGPKLFPELLELVGRRFKGKARRGDQQPSSARTGV
ncbi:unnamed protein product, partial [Ascophyllum nodosum]